ncbi:APC family permease [Weissella tructae]|uniref:APC family amino acid-polyamine-organocation transporter n=2 Tax=Weissella TaxID=46255 RepID=A0A075U624_9LACO|nr:MULTISPECIES: amino acid permease [Weissella]AIG65577.1 APC family amino acid-polyamine-organocation transporter [Weissella tructae]AIM62892.1 APC family amino acid-polyamine-organocation transporter [Weissella ceti]AIM64290.1 APC family amino acid-polyamine-organocation transporter [Weissella ceti]ELA06966.1 amino acid permease-associated protein [Weissella ceti NC36]QVV90709.1 amino acid permease [Weissella tructae]
MAGKHLQRSMGLTTGISIVVGTIIGSGIFFKQAQVLSITGSTTGALLAWLFGGLITLMAGLTISELGSRIPSTGGLYVYIHKVFGPAAGFLSGWGQSFLYGPAIVASLSAYFAILITNFFYLPSEWAKWIGLLSIIFITGINLLDNRVPAAFAVATTSIKLLPIIAIIVFGLFFGNVNALGQTLDTIVATPGGGFGMAILATLYAYDGWATLTSLGGELKDPIKNIPRSIIYGLIIVIVAYVGITYGVMQSMPANEIIALGDNATFGVVTTAFGDLGGRLLSLAILISIAGTLNGKMMALPRSIYAMAEDGMMPKFMMYINRAQEPAGAILTLATLGAALQFSASADWLSNACMFIIWMFYLMAFYGLIRLRRADKAAGIARRENIFLVPLYPVIPILAGLGATYVLFSTLINDPISALVSIGLVLAGLPIYFYYTKMANK